MKCQLSFKAIDFKSMRMIINSMTVRSQQASFLTGKNKDYVVNQSAQVATDLSHVRIHDNGINIQASPVMVDVSEKTITSRTAIAGGRVYLPQEIVTSLSLLPGAVEILGKKGPVINTAIVAAVMGAKQTSSLIPFCHPISIEKCDIDISVQDNKSYNVKEFPSCIVIKATIKCSGKTGVEMEALTAVSIAALTVYDMLKAISHNITIGDIRLLTKTGGKSDL